MKEMKRLLAALLVTVMFCMMFAGCGEVSEDNDIMGTGEFYASFIEEENLYSDTYSDEEIEKNNSYELEEKVMLEWGLIDEDQLGLINKGVTKELVAQICFRNLPFYDECEDVAIKDIEKCHDQEAIKNAVGLGLFELSNGYFEALDTLTYDECDEAIERAKEYTRNYRSEKTEYDLDYKDNVYNVDGSNIKIVEYPDEEINEEDAEIEKTVEQGGKYEASVLSVYSEKSTQKLANNNSQQDIVASITKMEYESHKDTYRVGNYLTIKDTYFSTVGPPNLCGEIKKVDVMGQQVFLQLKKMDDFSEILRDPDALDATVSSSQKGDTEVKPKEGFTLGKTASGKGLYAEYSKTVGLENVIYENPRSDWRNQKCSPSVYLHAEASDFSVTTKKLYKILSGDAKEASIKVDFTTMINLKLEAGGLRYSPANNGNGKFPANWKNSRWTGLDAAGSKGIKVGTVKIPLGTTGIELQIPVYIYIHMDGSLETKITQKNSFVITFANGKPKVSNESEKPKKSFTMCANIEAGLQIRPNLWIWGMQIIDIEASGGLLLEGAVSVFSKEDDGYKTEGEDLWVTKAELDDLNSDYCYCTELTLSFVARGTFMTSKSEVGKIVRKSWPNLIPSLDKKWIIFSKHIEDGQKEMSSCSRLNKEKSVEVNKEGEIILDSYKQVFDGSSMGVATVKITSVPISDKKIDEYQEKKGGIKVTSFDKDVVTAKYDEEKKHITLYAKGEGSTEIFVSIKTSKEGKVKYSQTISVTVQPDFKVTTTSFDGEAIFAPLNDRMPSVAV